MHIKHRPILLVEDNPDDVTLTRRAMKKAGVVNTINVAEDGAQALELLLGDDSNQLPALVLLDLNLPKVDGLEVLRQIRQHEQTAMLPVVILTTSKEESDLINGYKLGVNSYIQKPVNFEDFTKAVSQLSLYWLILNEPPPVPEGR
jgi:CheY-like chemotaxis protein